MKRGRWGWFATSAAIAAVALVVAAAITGRDPGPRDAAPIVYERADFAAVPVDRGQGRRNLRLGRGVESPVPPASAAVEWREAALPVRVRGGGGLVGERRYAVHWYRVLHSLGDGAPGPLAVYVPRMQPGIGYADLYANGELLEAPGTRAANHWNQPLLAPIPERLLDGRRTLEVLVAVSWDTRTSYALAPIHVGAEAPLRRTAAWRTFLQSGAPEALSYAFLVLGLFALGFWVRRPRETPYLLFGLATIVWYLRTLHFHVVVVPIDGLLFWWVTVNSMGWLMVLVYLFALRFQGRRLPWAEYSLLALVLLTGLLTLPGVGLEPALTATLAYVAQAVVALAVTALLTRDALRTRAREPVVIAAALWINLAFGIYDLLLKDAYLDPCGIFLLPYGAVFLFGAFLYAVLRRYGDAIASVESVNVALEDRLAARTRELQATHERLRTIEREQTLAAERQRLMRDMHDGLGSSLMSSLVMVEQGRLQTTDVARVLRECIDDLKLTIDSLEPLDSDLVTLLATLRYRLGRRLEAAGLRLEWKVADLPRLPWLDALSALEVLRILQEVLTNVIKHSGAKSVTISTAVDGNEVRVRLADDGRGFDVPHVRAQSTGRGLLNLQRRATRIGGHVDLQSSPAGTVVELALPIERRAATADGPPAGVLERRGAGTTPR
jgi:signal transduction histidine kinase